jgi:hypothetical protein
LATQLIDKYRTDECFRKKVDEALGDAAKEYFTDPYKLSELLAEIGVGAATAGFGAWAETANGSAKLAKFAQFLEELKLGKLRKVAAEAESSGLGSGCFVAGTLVAVRSGFKEIQDIRVGDIVWSFDQQSDAWLLKPVEATFVHEYSGDVITITAGGVSIDVSGNHPFWVLSGRNLADRPAPVDVPPAERILTSSGRWVEARSLQVGDHLLYLGSESANVSQISDRFDRILVYNIRVSDTHTYAVSMRAVLVHNKSAPAGFAPGGKGVYGYYEEAPFRRVTNPKHHPGSVSPEPANVDALYRQSVWDENGVGWARDADGVIHRFSAPRNGEVHWNGSTSGVDPIRGNEIPNEILKALQ